MTLDPIACLATLTVGDTVTVTRIQYADSRARYMQLTAQHAPVTQVSHADVVVLGQPFRRTSEAGSAGHAITGPVAMLTPAEALPANQLQSWLNAALNTLLTPDQLARLQLAEAMASVPYWSVQDVITPGIVLEPEQAVAAQLTIEAALRRAAEEIEARMTEHERA